MRTFAEDLKVMYPSPVPKTRKWQKRRMTRRVSRTMVGPNSAYDFQRWVAQSWPAIANIRYSVGKHTTYNY
jgi:hypothetical protein